MKKETAIEFRGICPICGGDLRKNANNLYKADNPRRGARPRGGLGHTSGCQLERYTDADALALVVDEYLPMFTLDIERRRALAASVMLVALEDACTPARIKPERGEVYESDDALCPNYLRLEARQWFSADMTRTFSTMPLFADFLSLDVDYIREKCKKIFDEYDAGGLDPHYLSMSFWSFLNE